MDTKQTNSTDGERLDVLPAGIRLEVLQAQNAAANTSPMGTSMAAVCDPVVSSLLLGADVKCS